jgi:steroid delta-isomerase-like uncharacterized protein
MNENQNKILVRRVFEEMWNYSDLSVADEIFAQPEGARRFVSEFLTAFPDLHHTIEDMIAEGDRVVVRFSAHGTHTGPWRRYPVSGKPIHYTGVTLARVAGDRIVDHHTWWDILDVIEQITLLE